MKPANVTAGKGLTMWLLAVSGWVGDEHEASLHHGRQRVNDVVVAVSGVVTTGKGLMMCLLCQGC